MYKKIAIILALIAALCLGSFLTAWTAKDSLTGDANSSLYDLSQVMDTLEYINSAKLDDSKLREKLEIMVASKLVLMSQINPKLDDLQGTPIEALCRTLKYHKEFPIGKDGLGKHKDKELPRIASEYLTRIEEPLKEVVQNSIILSSMDGCNIWADGNKYYLSPSLRTQKKRWDVEFEEFLANFSSDDTFYYSRINERFWVEISTYDGDKFVDKTKLAKLPDSYTYGARVYPTNLNQEEYNLKLYLRPPIMKDLRIVTNDSINQNESISYWFNRKDNDWALSNIVINKELQNKQVEKRAAK